MKTKTVHTIAIALLFVMFGINIYADGKHRLEFIDVQVGNMLNLSEARSALLELKTTLGELPVFIDAVNANQRAIKALLESAAKAQGRTAFVLDTLADQQKQIGILFKHETEKMDKELKEIKKARLKTKCDFSINGSPFAPECLPI